MIPNMNKNKAGAASANSTAVLARRSLTRARRRRLIRCMMGCCIVALISLFHAYDGSRGQCRRAAEDRVRHDRGVGERCRERDVVAGIAAIRAAVRGAAWRA